MAEYLVEYHYQTDHCLDDGFEDHYESCLVEANTAAEASSAVESKVGGWVDIECVTRFQDFATDFIVDLCDNNETIGTFVVKANLPEEGSRSSKAYAESRGRALGLAEEVIKRDYPDFFAKINKIRNKLDDDLRINVIDTMVIVRPASWVVSGLKSYLVKVDYKMGDGSDSYYIETVRARDEHEAMAKAADRVGKFYSCNAVPKIARRIADQKPYSNVL